MAGPAKQQQQQHRSKGGGAQQHGSKHTAGKKRPFPAGKDGPAAKKQSRDDKPSAGKGAPAVPMTRRDQKEAAAARKARSRRHFQTVQEAVQLWERLRPKSTSSEEKRELAERIVGMFSGKVLDLANQHTASRVIQFCLKEGSPETRAALSLEIRKHAVELAKSRYGHYLVSKLINAAPKADVPALAALFKGRVAELLRHPTGADVLTDLYDAAPASLRNALCAECYGREYALFDGVGASGGGGGGSSGGGASRPLASEVGHLRQLLDGAAPAKRTAVLQHLTRCLQPALEKALLHPPMAHRLLRELLEAAPGSVVADAVDTLAATGGSVLKMVHTHDGAAAACMALAYGTPKDRKRLVKGMKGFVWQMAENEWGHAAAAAALSVTDDTALTGKVVVGEIKGNLDAYLDHKHAARVLLQLLAPLSPRYLPPAILALLTPPRRTVMEAPQKAGGGGGGDSDEEMEEEEEEQQQQDQKQKGAGGGGADGEAPQLVERVLGESKKDPAVRRRELLGTGPDSLGAALARAVAARAPSLLRAPPGADVAVEVARGAADGLLWAAQRGGVEAVHAAIIDEVLRLPPSSGGKQQQQQQPKGKKQKQQQQQQGGDGAQDGGDEEGAPLPEGPLLTDYYGSRALRRLVLFSTEPGAGGDAARAFAQALWARALAGNCAQWAGSHADKVLAALVVCGDAPTAAAAAKELGPLVGGDAAAWAATHGAGGPDGGGKAAGGHAAGGKKQQQQKQQQKPTPAGKKRKA